MKLNRILFAMMTMVIFFALIGCGEDEQEHQAAELPTAAVRVVDLDGSSDLAFFETVGRVKNVKEATLASKVSGAVTDVQVKAGDKVRKGQTLMRIEAKDVMGQLQQARGALAQAEAAFSIAKSNLDRFEDLKASGSASQAEYDKARFDYDTAQGAVRQAKGAVATANSFMAEARVEAPFAGTVVDTMIEQGEMVGPGRPLLRIEGESDLEFETTVNERDVSLISVGQKVPVILDSSRNDKQEYQGKISEIVPSSDGTHSNTVRIELGDVEGLRSGMFGRAHFPRGEGAESSILIASDKIQHHGQLSTVYVVDETDTVRLRLIREGRSIGSQTEILSGIRSGDRLIVSELEDLIDGQPAKAVQ